jgi:hypothetical protein
MLLKTADEAAPLLGREAEQRLLTSVLDEVVMQGRS